jgi:AcrR family transcriptional regulator
VHDATVYGTITIGHAEVRTMAPREPSGATRRRILDVALELFIEQGYDRTSLREIAERLGFSKAALYYHYKAKDDILRALADALMADLDEVLDRVGQEPPGPARARHALTEMVDLMLRQRGVAQLIITQSSAIQRLKETRDHAYQSRLQQLMSPPGASLETRVRASAALAVTQSALWHLQEDDLDTVRSTVLSLALACLEPSAERAGQA